MCSPPSVTNSPTWNPLSNIKPPYREFPISSRFTLHALHRYASSPCTKSSRPPTVYFISVKVGMNRKLKKSKGFEPIDQRILQIDLFLCRTLTGGSKTFSVFPPVRPCTATVSPLRCWFPKTWAREVGGGMPVVGNGLMPITLNFSLCGGPSVQRYADVFEKVKNIPIGR